MKFLLVFLVGLVAVHCVPLSIMEEWIQFKLKHNKRYANEDEEYFRIKIFMDNYYKITEHNQKYEKGLVSFKMGVNKFADLLSHEIPKGLTMKDERLNKVEKHVSTNIKYPDSIDWREKGAVTDVKSQEDCGVCWAFSSTGAIEGQHFLKTGKLVSLSEQNLVDCVNKEGDCNSGGLMVSAFQYVIKNGGIDTEESYPYEDTKGVCRYKPENVGATISNYKQIEEYNEDDLLDAVATIGPVSIGVNANEAFMKYNSGIFDDPECDPFHLNHGVLAVGYGTSKDGKDFWIVKNSWGEGWGEEGYIRIARNQSNMCGVATYASYPLV